MHAAWLELQRTDTALVSPPRPISYHQTIHARRQASLEIAHAAHLAAPTTSHIDEVWEQLKLTDRQYARQHKCELTELLPTAMDTGGLKGESHKRGCDRIELGKLDAQLPTETASPLSTSAFKRLKLDDAQVAADQWPWA